MKVLSVLEQQRPCAAWGLLGWVLKLKLGVLPSPMCLCM